MKTGTGIARSLAFIAALTLGNMTWAAHIEVNDGDLSNDSGSPTLVSLVNGSNTVSGSAQAGSDPDFFAIVLGANQQLDALVLTSYAGPAGGNGSFLAVQSGLSINTGSAGAHLGNELIGKLPGLSQGDNILPELGTPRFGGSGFTGALTAGAYTFWIQETAGTVDYTFDLQVSQVPLPAAVWLFGTALLGLIGIGRRKARA